VNVEENDNRGAFETIHVEPRVDRRLHVLDAIARVNASSWSAVAPRFADVIAADRDGVPARDPLGAELERYPPPACAGRVERCLLLGDVFLQDFVWVVPRQLVQAEAAFFRS